MIEHELYNYDSTREVIEALKDEIIGSPPLPIGDQDNIQRTTVSDPTHAKAVKLTTNATLLYMERTIKEIDRALMVLGEDHNEIFELKYRQGKSWQAVADEIPVSRETYFRKRRDIILTVACNLGIANPS